MERAGVTDRREHPFFMADSAVVLEHGARIVSNALALYTALACFANSRSVECYPPMRRLMQTLGRGRAVVTESIGVLKAHGLLAVEARRHAHGGQASSLYTLLPVPAKADEPVPIADGLVHAADGGRTQSGRPRPPGRTPPVLPGVLPPSSGAYSPRSHSGHRTRVIRTRRI